LVARAKIILFTSPTLRPEKPYAEMAFVPEDFLSRHRLGADMIVYSKFFEMGPYPRGKDASQRAPLYTSMRWSLIARDDIWSGHPFWS